jgi:2-phosphoglycolate phosphatase
VPTLDDLATPKLVAFDLDGTLIDSRGDIAAACNHALVSAGRAPLSPETIATFVGDGARSLLARAFGIASDAPELDAIVDVWRGYYVAHPIDCSTWMPGALDALDACAHRGIAVALVTNKARVVTERIVDALGVADRFVTLYAGGDGPLKPSGEPMLAVTRAAAVDPPDAWLIGDAEQDIGSARAAGCIAVAVLGGFHDEARLRAARPDVIVASLCDVATHLAAGFTPRL